MRSLEELLAASRVLVRHPGRTVLTIVGLAIGVAAFIATVSFGVGARRSVLAQFEALGTNLLRVRVLPKGPDRPGSQRLFFPTDIAALRREGTTFDRVAPLAYNERVLQHGGASTPTVLWATSPDWLDIRGRTVAAGGFFDEADMQGNARVCVLGATPARALFGERDAVGATVAVGSSFPCRVIGVLTPAGRSTNGADLDDFALIPLSTCALYIGLPKGFATIELRPRSSELREAAREEARALLRRSFGRADDEPDHFTIQSSDDVIQAADETSRILGLLLAGIAAVSLLVGGIGIMNIQLVSVSERTHEIGIRGAIGASPSAIRRQFLAEAVMLASTGSLVGVLVGVGASLGVGAAMGWRDHVSPWVVVGSAAFGIVVGVIFGYMPASRAANLDPVVALRRE